MNKTKKKPYLSEKEIRLLISNQTALFFNQGVSVGNRITDTLKNNQGKGTYLKLNGVNFEFENAGKTVIAPIHINFFLNDSSRKISINEITLDVLKPIDFEIGKSFYYPPIPFTDIQIDSRSFITTEIYTPEELNYRIIYFCDRIDTNA